MFVHSRHCQHVIAQQQPWQVGRGFSGSSGVRIQTFVQAVGLSRVKKK